ncbi:hypothetical protein C8R43DRAFT_849959, partial [Mycena crocata]
RLEEISSAIEVHKQALRDLADSKHEVKGRLNAIRDPITRFPLDISSEIFLRCLPEFPTPHPALAPMVLLHVCRSWSQIALSTSSLW